MIDVSVFIVFIGIIASLGVLVLDKMRPGFTLFACAIIFMMAGIITPEELIAGFSSKQMITVAMLFLIGEGVRQSGSLTYLVRHMLPEKGRNVGRLLGRLLPIITAISMFINNTAVVIIFAPIIKRWAERVDIPVTKFLIPLSYATIFGGVCTLIGTSTNLVVNGLMIDAGYRGFTMFEIGQVGAVIAVVGILYLMIFANRLLPGSNRDKEEEKGTVEIVLAARFPGVGRTLQEFNFERHYGAKVEAVIKNGERVEKGFDTYILNQGDTLCLSADVTFARTWRESSAFHIISYGDIGEEADTDTPMGGKRRWLGLALLIFMVCGATMGEYIDAGRTVIDIFSAAAIVMVVMAVAGLFPAKRYTKFITWDILVAIASAFAISKAMSNSGINEMIATWIISATSSWGNYAVLAMLYLVTMLLTEFITNNAAVAIAFPVALALGEQLGINPMPLFVAICIAASASFSSPIGYQTNLIVQGVGGYKFKDYLRVGIWLNLLTFIISIILIPRIWEF